MNEPRRDEGGSERVHVLLRELLERNRASDYWRSTSMGAHAVPDSLLQQAIEEIERLRKALINVGATNTWKDALRVAREALDA